MPTLKENYDMWNNVWKLSGDEWSETWGGANKQWSEAILPRIQRYVPAGTILEIAPGHGRWTQFLSKQCLELMVVDISDTCITACKERFKDQNHITYFVNDGMSLNMIPNNSIDFVFSFDSLVHAEADVIKSYLSQLKNKLKPTGAGFIHHSNAGQYKFSEPDPNWRAASMSAEVFRKYAADAGLICTDQELINWASAHLNDCFSVITNDQTLQKTPCNIIENPNFMKEAQAIREGKYDK